MAEDEGLHSGGRDQDGYGLGRLLALSDGVFAIAMTLLVLSIPVPQLTSLQGEGELTAALWKVLPNLLGFAISFALVGLYWMVHHRIFRWVLRVDQRLQALNLMALFLICLVPFPAALEARYSNLLPAFELYCANLALIGIVYAGLTAYLRRAGLMRESHLREWRIGMCRNALGTAVFAFAMFIALVSIPVAGFSLLLLAPTNAVAKVMGNRWTDHVERGTPKAVG
ncbi:MAG: DUF1211 domain-containing protein [Candidatus Dormibacteraeota bacterium]|uniref:DUF1211 domain-containing protein n=1 Tax=Candidatus Dormiibacter inghamiae TaxID=3127013 RepID=A0A934N6P1_9BACT|nr:DUF1211 domain-containing protein [Candidatus Dormibacteraeota bacterium]MBJ7606103.1 DUF1211 domain-containing protein [Candidatus Dormibacteraeota bacterium]